MLEQLQTIISVGLLIVSMLTLITTVGYVMITRDQSLTSKGILETEIRKNIVETRLRIIEYANKIPDKLSDNEKESIKLIIESLYEDYRNAYEDACSKYEDKKIDRKRFEKMYKDSIRQLVENSVHKEFYSEPQTKYTCTLNFYKNFKN
ncbi:hypothetical protein [Campylobacter concisus]|jgi:hypothetical protein|uniref:hypothetical protein n=1 Tax=Campylobacter concisus TaxID=199 RepID=UPI000B3D6F0E|nr:hypothetical protein [Campylobacter concisus]OUT13840.1 hypothetical protein B9N63_05165 [Campylobacter concisus]